MNIQRNGINLNNVSFTGHNRKLDKYGLEAHRFYYLYDSEKYDCFLELYEISKDAKNNLKIGKKIEINDGTTDKSGGFIDKDVDLSKYSDGFAYRFKLVNKQNEKDFSYAFDNGQVIGIFDENKGNQYNVVLNNRAIINQNGPMQLIMPDEYYPGMERTIDGSLQVAEALRAQQRKAIRTHANKLGGQFVGITKRLKDGKFSEEGIKRIVGTPFTKDMISSHKYWTENAYQVSPDLGTELDFREMQEELFKNGINWIADAALVNEGFGGIHMSELLRKGDSSVSKNMFRVQGDQIMLGILPNDFAQKGHTRLKIINAPFVVSDDGKTASSASNAAYNPAKPTYIQFYDSRLASKEQIESDSPMALTTYAKKNVDDNMYAITKHDDAVYPFPIEVSPEELKRSIAKICGNKGKVNLADAETIKAIAEGFSKFKIVNKSAAGGLEFWDGNVDIAKLNFFVSRQDGQRFAGSDQEQINDFIRGTYAVREYAVNSGKYWTQLTADAQLEYASKFFAGKNLETAEEYHKEIQKGASIQTGQKTSQLPPSAGDASIIDEEVVENVLTGDYNLRRLYEVDMRSPINPDYSTYVADYTLDDYILKKAMDVPLETLPVATNLLGILTSPYIAKKPNTQEEIGVSRFDTHKAGNPNLPDKYSSVYKKTEEFYTSKIVPYIKDILDSVKGIKNEDGSVSDLGRYVISEVTPDLVRYIMVRSLSPNVKIEPNKDGILDFSKVSAEDITMQSLGIAYDGNTSQQEAQKVVYALNKGFSTLEKDDTANFLKQIVSARIGSRTLNDYKIAEMIIDRTESGLGWRIDAAKDVASIDAVRSESDTGENAWDNVIDVWKLFNQSVLNINPHAYTTAELTDLGDVFPKYQQDGKYKKEGDAERKFIQETGITSVANYNYFFSLLPELFSTASFETGMPNWAAINGQNDELLRKFDTGWTYGDMPNNPGFLFQSPADGVINSYTFVGNHDKPRILHCLALDMNLFHFGYLSDSEEQDLKKKIAKGGDTYAMQQKLNFDPQNKKKTLEFFDIEQESQEAKNQDSVKAQNQDSVNAENQDVVEVESLDYSKLSPEAVAMGIEIKEAIKALDTNSVIKKSLIDALKSIVRYGQYKDKEIDTKAFGTRSFEHAVKSVFDHSEFVYGKIKDRELLERKVLETMLDPAFEKFFSIYKTLMLLPGSPTDFAGDRLGSTGYETKAKNYHQQNRNIINWENIDEKNSDYSVFLKKKYDILNQFANLRRKPELSALNDGATMTMSLGNSALAEKVQSIIRYNENSTVLCFFDNNCYTPQEEGSSLVLHNKMDRRETVISDNNKRIYFSTGGENVKRGLKHGLEVGSKFKNANAKDKDAIYTVKEDSNGYYLEKTVNGVVEEISITKDDYNSLVLYKEKKKN